MDPLELIFLKNLDPRNIFFQKKGWNIWTPYEKIGPPWNLFFKRQLKNMDSVELIFQKTVEKYGPLGTYFSQDSWRPIWNTLKRTTEKYETLWYL